MDWNSALAGAGSGAMTGASIGTAINPGVGTAVGAGIGGGIGLLQAYLSGDPYKIAEEEAKHGYGQAENYQRPYWQKGLDQTGRLNEAENNLLHPEKLQKEWANSYEQSPWAKRLLQMNQGQGLDAASSMGLMGSSGALANIQQGAGDITAKDRQAYMDDLMKKYLEGIGLGKNIYGVGAQTGANLGQQATDQGTTMANLGYGRTARPGNMFATGAGTATSIIANKYLPQNQGNMVNAGNQYNMPEFPSYGRNSIFGVQ